MHRFSSALGVLLALSVIGGPGAATAQEADEAMAMDMDSREWVQVSNDAEKEELTFLVGPIELPANAGHHTVKNPPLVPVTIPINAYLYGFDVQMEDASGQPISNRTLHHFNLIDPHHRELFSPIALRIFAAGGETQGQSMPRWLGLPLTEGQEMAVSAMFHNPTSDGYPEAYLRVTLKYRKKGWIFPLSVYPMYMDVMGHVGEKEFDLPPGVTEVA